MGNAQCNGRGCSCFGSASRKNSAPARVVEREVPAASPESWSGIRNQHGQRVGYGSVVNPVTGITKTGQMEYGYPVQQWEVFQGNTLVAIEEYDTGNERGNLLKITKMEGYGVPGVVIWPAPVPMAPIIPPAVPPLPAGDVPPPPPPPDPLPVAIAAENFRPPM